MTNVWAFCLFLTRETVNEPKFRYEVVNLFAPSGRKLSILACFKTRLKQRNTSEYIALTEWMLDTVKHISVLKSHLGDEYLSFRIHVREEKRAFELGGLESKTNKMI